MARIDTLTNFLNDVADSIRTKKGTTNTILASNFDTEIESIQTSGVEPKLQNKDVTITTNGIHSITADEGYDGLNNVNITTNVENGGSTIEPNYIIDGLTAWFDGEDSMDSNGHWNSRVGNDYIYTTGGTLPQYSSIANRIDTIKTNNGYVNNMAYSLSTSVDYYQQGYTIEIVGKIHTYMTSSNTSSGNTTGGCLFSIGRTCAICTNLYDIDGKLRIVNDTGVVQPNITIGYDNIFKISLNFLSPNLRSATMLQNETISYSINGNSWTNFGISYKTSTVSSNDNTCNILSYYKGSYRSNATIYCMRVYNRQLTNEELAHNYEIDKLRYNIEEVILNEESMD